MRAFVLAACTLAIAWPAQSWDRAGHRKACHKAWREMTETARDGVSNLLEIATADDFANSCTSADDLAHARPETTSWHVISLSLIHI